MILAYQIIAVVVFIALGAFFSGTETGIYRLSRFRLRLAVQKKQPFASLLAKVMRDSRSLIFSMLIGTNLANYIVTGIVTIIFLSSTATRVNAELYATVCIAPILFIFSEILPKNIYFHRADTLMPKLAPAIWFFHKLFIFTGLSPLLKLISAFFARLANLEVSVGTAVADSYRHQIRQIFLETHEEDILSPTQSDIINRLVNIPTIPLSSVMVPLGETCLADVNSNHEKMLNLLKNFSFTRILVYENSRRNIIGFINIYEVLCCGKDFSDLRPFLKPLPSFSTAASILDTLSSMRRQYRKIALVTRPAGKPIVGIVTIEDLVEELTGDLS